MQLWRSVSAGRPQGAAFLALLALAMVAACRRDNSIAVDRNRPPETFITLGPESSRDPEDPVDLFYRAHLFWRGEDIDGTVAGFRYAVDDTADPDAWYWTTRTDSVFRFPAAEVGAREHLFLIRAVDNLGKQDPTPDTLRFESFTRCPPDARFDGARTIVESPTQGTRVGLDRGDTVEVFSGVTFFWNGNDCDGFIVGWESKFDDEREWRFHEITDTTRTASDLAPGLHTMALRAIDDAGAKSTEPDRFRVRANYDPVTRIDLGSIEARLERTWLPPGDPERWLIVGPGVAEGDTLPMGATVSMCWTSTDIDGPVIRYQWNFAELLGQTEALCVSTDTTGTDPVTGDSIPEVLGVSSGGLELPFMVKGIDVFENVEQAPDTVSLHVNFRPEVWFTGPDPDTAVVGPPHRFPFQGSDKDSDPRNLQYRWRFVSGNTTDSDGPRVFHPDSLFISRAFTPSQVGLPHKLLIWAQDPSGGIRESLPDTVRFVVVSPLEMGKGQAPEGAS